VAAGVVALIVILVVMFSGNGNDGTTSTTSPSGGDGTVTVPQVNGLLPAEATAQLQGAGLKVKRVDRPSFTTAVGTVSAVSPNGEVEEGSTVTMAVSTGAWIAYITDRKDANPVSCDPNCDWDIYLTQPDGPQEKLITDPASDMWPAWSPDGSKLAFSSDRSGNEEIYVIGSDGKGLTRMTNNPADERYPSWSPDGSKITFTSDRAGSQDVWVMNADGTGNPTQLTRDPASDEAPRWSPDGSTIVFFTNRDGRRQVYLMDPDGSNQRNISNSTTDDLGGVWSPDGTKLAFRRSGDVWVMNADGTGAQQLTFTAKDAQPTWSPDGQSIAFRSSRTGDEDIWLMNTDGSGARDLTNTPGTNEERPVWLP
jgi:Tol biopolymer transport system component